MCLFLYHKVSNCKLSNALQRMPDWFHNDLLGIYRLPQIKIISFGKCHLTIEGITFFLSVARKICNSVKTIHGLSSILTTHFSIHSLSLKYYLQRVSPENKLFAVFHLPLVIAFRMDFDGSPIPATDCRVSRTTRLSELIICCKIYRRKRFFFCKAFDCLLFS